MTAPKTAATPMTLDDAFTELAYTKQWTHQTRQWYEAHLRRFFAWCKRADVDDLSGVTAPLVRRYLDELRTTPNQRTGQPLDSFTLHGHARAIRTLLFWAANEDLVDERIPKRIALPRREQKVLRILNDGQLERLFDMAKRTDTPLRDMAILSLLVDTGLRASEMCGLELRDVTFTPDAAWLLVRHGKGRKQREVGMGKKARAALHRYIHRERQQVFHPATTEQALFLGRKGPLASEGLDRLLYRLRDEAGAEHFEGVSVGAHRFRHLHAVKSLEAGMDIYSLSRQMGHSDIGVTTGYLKAVSSRALRQLAISPLDTL